VRAVLLVVVFACAQPRGPTEGSIDGPDEPFERERHYTIWLGGGRVGTASEREIWTRTAMQLHRHETMVFFRGDEKIALATTIEIEADRALAPRRVAWTERADGPEPTERRAVATRAAIGGWSLPQLAGDAVPAELVPLLVRRDGTFDGRVFLPARGFLGGTGRIEAVAPRRLVARLELDGGAIAEATIDLDDRGDYVRVVDGEGVIALAVTAEQAAAPFQPLDLIAATAIPITGAPSHTLVLEGSIALPPLPGQLVRRHPDGIALELSPQLAGDLPGAAPGRDRSRDIAALVERVRARIAPDLSAGPASPRDADSATAGDCTTFALAYAALAHQHRIPTRVVTGLRVDGSRLVRHRWAVSWTGRAWIAVDVAYGVAPAGGDLVGLAVHDADDAGLVAGEAALTQVRGAAWR
jgi:hypothetical protein